VCVFIRQVHQGKAQNNNAGSGEVANAVHIDDGRNKNKKEKKRKRKKNKAKEKEKRESSSPPTRVESYTTHTISDNHGRKGRRARQKFVNHSEEKNKGWLLQQHQRTMVKKKKRVDNRSYQQSRLSTGGVQQGLRNKKSRIRLSAPEAWWTVECPAEFEVSTHVYRYECGSKGAP